MNTFHYDFEGSFLLYLFFRRLICELSERTMHLPSNKLKKFVGSNSAFQRKCHYSFSYVLE